MFLSQHHLDGLGCLSYVVGDGESGEAVVVDPQMVIDEYLRETASEGLRITHVIDTHLHADHLSGARALAATTGATLHLPAAAGARFGHSALRNGTEIRLGDFVLRVRETPGHTPEHVTLEVIDLSAGSEEPYAILTGDTLFVGSVGRPDLVGTKPADELARMLYASTRDLVDATPRGTIVYPGHAAGSACGTGMSPLRMSTLGYELATNPFLQHATEDAFVADLTAELPPKPGNATNLKRLNTNGPPERVPTVDSAPALDAAAFAELAADEPDGALVIDTREPDAFAANHVPGAINVAISSSRFPNRVAHLLEWGLPVLLVLDDVAHLRRAVHGLARVGGLNVRGWLHGGMEAWREAGRPFAVLDTLHPAAARAELDAGTARLLDVRARSEWENGHVEGATWMPWESLDVRVDELDADTRWIVTCASGYRSSIAASILARRGLHDVANMLGGMTAWRKAGLPLARARTAERAAAR